MDIHILKGGIGKQIAFTSILDKLKEEICVSSKYYRLFEDIPIVKGLYPEASIEIVENKRIFNCFNKIHYVDPYFSNFLKGHMHIIEAYHEVYGLKCDGLYHNCDFSAEQIHYYSKFIQELGEFVLVQFTGSVKSEKILLNRNLDQKTAQQIIDILKYDLKLNVVDVNEGQSIYKNTFSPRKSIGYREYLLMIKYCKGFICIDSSLNHMSAYKKNPAKGVCLWRDEYYSKLFRYSHNTNIMSKLPLKMTFDAQDVIDAYQDTAK